MNTTQKWWIVKIENGNRTELDLNFNGTEPEVTAKAKQLFIEHFGEKPTTEKDRFMKGEKGLIKVMGPISDKKTAPDYMHIQ